MKASRRGFSSFLIVAMFLIPFHGSLAQAEEIPPGALAKAKSTAEGLMKDLIGLPFFNP